MDTGFLDIKVLSTMQDHLNEDEHRNIYHSPSAEKKTDIDNTLANAIGLLFHEFSF